MGPLLPGGVPAAAAVLDEIRLPDRDSLSVQPEGRQGAAGIVGRKQMLLPFVQADVAGICPSGGEAGPGRQPLLPYAECPDPPPG